jgi:hypothetical protein
MKYPRLGNYPQNATQEELANYVDKLTDWATNAEDAVNKVMELIRNAPIPVEEVLTEIQNILSGKEVMG